VGVSEKQWVDRREAGQTSADLVLPDAALDPCLEGVSKQPDVTLVAYLRQSLRAVGFPGLAAQSDVPPWLAGLTEGLEAF
jgi:hypothetical protein